MKSFDLGRCRVLDLSQNFSMDSPPFAYYEGPKITWVKRVAFEGVNAQHISTTNHIATHLDSPLHFFGIRVRGRSSASGSWTVGSAIWQSMRLVQTIPSIPRSAMPGVT